MADESRVEKGRKFLGPDEMQAFLERVTYRPGWNIRLDVHGVDRLGPLVRGVLKVSYRAENTYEPGHSITVGSVWPLPGLPVDERAFTYFVFSKLEDMERHECREWFKVDGAMPFDPHKEGR